MNKKINYKKIKRVAIKSYFISIAITYLALSILVLILQEPLGVMSSCIASLCTAILFYKYFKEL